MGQVTQHYFFCGIGGSGMMPLALILRAQGHRISGSDRSYDNGNTPDKFQTLQNLGINLEPQDGSGVTKAVETLVVSGAIEDSVPDVRAAKDLGITIKTRAEILADLFNRFDCGISVAGTSGKSTTTGMIATILSETGKDPTVMNGGLIENFTGQAASPFPNMRTGQSDIFVTETDESDGSIALYNPAIAVLNNIALDHMPLEQLQSIFADFISRATRVAIVNVEDPLVRQLAAQASKPVKTYAINHEADLRAEQIVCTPRGVEFLLQGKAVSLKVPGRHNVLNALAALSAAQACDVSLDQAITALEKFTGIRRRMQIVGTQNEITIIDDFAHNPDKIAASLQTLKEFDGRVLIMFQMHGFGPIKLMGKEIIDSFAQYLSPDDQLLMPEVYYAGGTVDRSKTAEDMIADARGRGLSATWFENRELVKDYLLQEAAKGDRIVIMGARDDTLTSFAKEILAAI